MAQTVDKPQSTVRVAFGDLHAFGLATLRLDLTIPQSSANPPLEAKIASDFYSIGAIFAFVGFVSALPLQWNF